MPRQDRLVALCLGCHYHQYELGPTHDQVSTWRTEVGDLVRVSV
ncbi:hypothetical protein AB0M28_23030 [Streptomyces sp. NPDC051940]